MISPAARRTMHLLLRADAIRSDAKNERNRLVAAAIGFANLFFCAYWERFLADDPHGTALILFFTSESFLFVIVALSSFWTGSADTIYRTRIFPVSALGTFSFVIAAFLRRPVVIALVVTNAMFMLINYHETIPVAVVGVLFVLLTPLLCGVFVSTGMLLLGSRSTPFPGTGLLIVAVTAMFIILTIAHGAESIVGMVPPGGWAAHGVHAALTGNWWMVAIPGASLMALALLLWAIGIYVMRKR